MVACPASGDLVGYTRHMTDTGDGDYEEHRLFERAYTCDSTLDDATMGLGLGWGLGLFRLSSDEIYESAIVFILFSERANDV